MKSNLAALRWIVLPWGAGPGTPRIVIDAVNGEMVFYDANDVPVIQLGPDTGGEQTIAVRDAIGDAIKMFVDTNFFNRPVLEFTALTAGGLGIVSNILANSVGTTGANAYTEMRIQTNGLGTNTTLYVRSGSSDGVTQRAEIAVDQPVVVNGEVWHNLALQNAWVADNAAGAGETPGYRYMPDGTVLLRGWAKNGATAITTLLASALPAGRRPSKITYHVCAMPNSNTNQATIFMNTAGELRIASMPAATVAFDGLRFPVSAL